MSQRRRNGSSDDPYAGTAESQVYSRRTARKSSAVRGRRRAGGQCEAPLVSSDLIHNPYSAIVDGLSTMVIGNLVKVLAWYDNEWGYSVKMVRMIEKICRMGSA